MFEKDWHTLLKVCNINTDLTEILTQIKEAEAGGPCQSLQDAYVRSWLKDDTVGADSEDQAALVEQILAVRPEDLPWETPFSAVLAVEEAPAPRCEVASQIRMQVDDGSPRTILSTADATAVIDRAPFNVTWGTANKKQQTRIRITHRGKARMQFPRNPSVPPILTEVFISPDVPHSLFSAWVTPTLKDRATEGYMLHVPSGQRIPVSTVRGCSAFLDVELLACPGDDSATSGAGCPRCCAVAANLPHEATHFPSRRGCLHCASQKAKGPYHRSISKRKREAMTKAAAPATETEDDADETPIAEAEDDADETPAPETGTKIFRRPIREDGSLAPADEEQECTWGELIEIDGIESRERSLKGTKYLYTALDVETGWADAFRARAKTGAGKKIVQRLLTSPGWVKAIKPDGAPELKKCQALRSLMAKPDVQISDAPRRPHVHEDSCNVERYQGVSKDHSLTLIAQAEADGWKEARRCYDCAYIHSTWLRNRLPRPAPQRSPFRKRFKKECELPPLGPWGSWAHGICAADDPKRPRYPQAKGIRGRFLYINDDNLYVLLVNGKEVTVPKVKFEAHYKIVAEGSLAVRAIESEPAGSHMDWTPVFTGDDEETVLAVQESAGASSAPDDTEPLAPGPVKKPNLEAPEWIRATEKECSKYIGAEAFSRATQAQVLEAKRRGVLRAMFGVASLKRDAERRLRFVASAPTGASPSSPGPTFVADTTFLLMCLSWLAQVTMALMIALLDVIGA